jgi:hypothetical protein
MKTNSFHSLALTGLAAVFMAPSLQADMTVATPVPSAVITTPVPNPNPNAATGMAEKDYGAVVKAALQPLRDKLAADRLALTDAKASGDAAKIAAAKDAIKADLTAIRDKRVAMEHERRAIGQAAKEGRDKSDDKREDKALKSEAHRDKADSMKDKAPERRY